MTDTTRTSQDSIPITLNGLPCEVTRGTSLREVIATHPEAKGEEWVGAQINNKIKDLNRALTEEVETACACTSAA